MNQALRLALALRYRQYIELFSDCVFRPGAAALEVFSRPERWWPGAALLLTAGYLSPFINFRLGLVFALALALVCRDRSGSWRWLAWLTLWSYSLLPGILGFQLSLACLQLTFAAVKASFILLGPEAFSGSKEALESGLKWFLLGGMALCSSLAVFGTLRMLLCSIRAVTQASWGGAWALGFLSFVVGLGLWTAPKALLRFMGFLG